MSIYTQLRHPYFIEDATIDDIPIGEIQAAIQAAWRADPAFAAEVAKRYGLYDKVCLRCVNAPLTAFEPSSLLKQRLDKLAYQLCVHCLGFEGVVSLRGEVAKLRV